MLPSSHAALAPGPAQVSLPAQDCLRSSRKQAAYRQTRRARQSRATNGSPRSAVVFTACLLLSTACSMLICCSLSGLRLIMMRHGESESAGEVQDHARHLTQRGVAEAKQVQSAQGDAALGKKAHGLTEGPACRWPCAWSRAAGSRTSSCAARHSAHCRPWRPCRLQCGISQACKSTRLHRLTPLQQWTA